MPRILVSEADDGGASGVIGLQSKLWRYRATEVGVFAANEPLEMILPSGTSGVRKRPSWADYNLLTRSRKYGFGSWSSNIIVDENFRVLRSGIPAPPMVPTVAAVAGPGVTTTSVCYLRFVDSLGERRGPLSAATANVALANQQRQWTLLPTTCVDPSVDCIEGVVANDGFLPRVAWRRQIGVTTTVTEAIATGALGEAPDDFTEMPLCEIGAIWRDRLAGAGNQQYPERVFLTDIGDLEQYAGLFLQTEGEPVVGMFFSNENFFFGSKKRIYRAAGFEVTDIVRDPEKPDIGLIGHHGIVNMHGLAIVPTNLGFYLYNGGWQYLMKDRATEWWREYKQYRDEYESAAAIFDPVEGLYKFGPVPHSEIPGYVYWTIDGKRLVPDIAQAQLSPVLANDARARQDAGSAVLYIPGGSAMAEVVTGSWDGRLRRENQEDDGTDNGDSYLKKLTIEPATEVVDAGGAFQTDGTTWKRAWNFIRTRLDISFLFLTGTEYVTEPRLPNVEGFLDVIPADLDLDSEPPALMDHPLDGMTGEGLCMRITVDSARVDEVRWSGWGGLSGPGLRVRGTVSPE